MIIKLIDEILAGEGNEGHSNLRVNGRPLSQVAQFLRADSIKKFNRGNESTTFSFRTHKLFDDQADAEVWMLERYPTLLSLCGLLTLTAKSETKEVERYVAIASIDSITISETGVSLFLDWEISGGKILTVKPT